MADLTLVIANKTYSSWSLRAWLLLKQAGIPFQEILLPLDSQEFHDKIGDYSPSRCVPVLLDGDTAIWDTLAIAEYLAEQFPEKNLWPTEVTARAFARSCVAEMHSGFLALRSNLPMNTRRRFEHYPVPVVAARDVARISGLWAACRGHHGGKGEMLFGNFSIPDAFFAPIVSRFRTYDVKLPDPLEQYMDAVIALPGMKEWYASAADESWIVAADEVDIP